MRCQLDLGSLDPGSRSRSKFWSDYGFTDSVFARKWCLLSRYSGPTTAITADRQHDKLIRSRVPMLRESHSFRSPCLRSPQALSGDSHTGMLRFRSLLAHNACKLQPSGLKIISTNSEL